MSLLGKAFKEIGAVAISAGVLAKIPYGGKRLLMHLRLQNGMPPVLCQPGFFEEVSWIERQCGRPLGGEVARGCEAGLLGRLGSRDGVKELHQALLNHRVPHGYFTKYPPGFAREVEELYEFKPGSIRSDYRGQRAAAWLRRFTRPGFASVLITDTALGVIEGHRAGFQNVIGLTSGGSPRGRLLGAGATIVTGSVSSILSNP